VPHPHDGKLALAYKLRRCSEELVDASNMAFSLNLVELSLQLLERASELLNTALKLQELGSRAVQISPLPEKPAKGA